ncbi:hypothetical protein KBD09_00115 [Candidatus Woesebacteria bacterium]|nr:hypothetical protein [Candidatus Woesebacteria bacterium]
MARKTRKQKVKTSLKLTKKPETVQAVMKQSPAKPSEKKTSSIILSAEDVEEARVTKRGIIKTLFLIAVLFLLQSGVFIAKSKGLLPF